MSVALRDFCQNVIYLASGRDNEGGRTGGGAMSGQPQLSGGASAHADGIVSASYSSYGSEANDTVGEMMNMHFKKATLEKKQTKGQKLIVAAAKGDVKSIEHLISHGVDVNTMVSSALLARPP